MKCGLSLYHQKLDENALQMSRQGLLNWIGIVIGAPAFLLLFFTQQIALGLLVLAIVVGLLWLNWFLNQPEFTIYEVEKTLTIHDACADKPH